MRETDEQDAEWHDTIEAIRESLSDLAAGRVKPWEEFDREFCARHGLPPSEGFTVLYRDDHLIALDKPAGLLAVPGRGAEKFDSLATRVQAEFPSATVVHRLDQETSGVMVMALDAEVHRHVQQQFERRCTEKRYVAVVAGVVVEDEGEINLPLANMFENPPRHAVELERGREAITRWQVLQRRDDRTRLELRPLTGRSHQLRVHLAHIGHPILGDSLYAPPDVRAQSARLLLHAEMLCITHPATSASLALRSDPPF